MTECPRTQEVSPSGQPRHSKGGGLLVQAGAALQVRWVIAPEQARYDVPAVRRVRCAVGSANRMTTINRAGFTARDRLGAGKVPAGHETGPRRGAPWVTSSWWVFARAVSAGCGRAEATASGGTLAVSGAIFVASIARLLLPGSQVGMIVSRKRLTDVITLAALAVGLLAAGFALPTPS